MVTGATAQWRAGGRSEWIAAVVVAATLTGCGGGGQGAAPAGGIVVSDQRAGRIEQFDPQTLKRTADWDVGGDPHVVVADARHHILWVSAPKTGTVQVLDDRTGKVGATLRLDKPDGMTLTPDGRTLLVTEGIDAGKPGHLAYIDTRTRQVVARVPLGHAPHAIAVTPDGRTAFVSEQYSSAVAVVDVEGRKRIGSIPAAGVPYQLVIAMGRLYVSRLFAGVVSVFDTTTRKQVASYQLEQGLSQLAVSPDGNRLFVAQKGLAFLAGYPNGNIGSSVAVVDLKTGAVFPVKVPPGPDALLISGPRMYVTSLGEGRLSSMDLASLKVTSVHTAEYPTGMARVG